MTLLDMTRACLTVALVLAAGGTGSAQSLPPAGAPPIEAQTPLVTQSPPDAQAAQETQSPPATQTPPATEAPPQQAAPPDPARRATQRPPRTPQRPPSSSGRATSDEARIPRDGGPTRQELTFTANLTGGYDDNVTGGLGSGSGVAPTAMASGTTAFLDGTLGYFKGNARRSIRMDGTGSLTAYPGYLDQPAPGGFVNVGVRTAVGRSVMFGISQRTGYEPLFNVYAPGASGAPLPPGVGEAAPATGLFERQSWNSLSTVSLDRNWSRQDSTSLSYSYNVRQYINDEYGDTWSQRVGAGYRRALGRGAGARVDYDYSDTEYDDSTGFTRPMIEHRIVGGPVVQRSLSRRRALVFSLAAGASYIESVRSTDRQPYKAWLPAGSASVTLALSPTSSVEASYRRDMSTLYGATDEVYATDTVSLTTGGRVASRLDLRVGASYGNWKTPIVSGVTDTLNTYGGWLQVRVALTEKVGAIASYYYYYHRYSNPGALPAGFPAEYDRNAVRVGLSVWVPMIGTPQRTRR